MKLLYFASVRQKIGRGEEDFPLPQGVRTVGELLDALRARGPHYAEALSEAARLRAARNQEHVPFDAPVHDADEIAFFPPVTGG
jgi:molybdopterin synthase sulfur carrier subunit